MPRQKPSGDIEKIELKIDGKKLLIALAVITLCIAGALIRLHPLGETDIPYHLDGILEARFAEAIASTGYLEPENDASYAATHTIYTPSYDAFLALISLITHEQPMEILQLLIAPITILFLLGCYALTSRISENQKVGLITLMAMATYGPFVFISQATWKEVLGIAFLPLIFVSFYLREDIRMRIISSVLIFLMPLIHHLVALIVLLVIGYVSTSTFLLARKEEKLKSINVIDILVTVVVADELFLYYSLVRFDRLEYLTPENGLYLLIGLTILVGIGVFYVSSRCLSDFWRRVLWASCASIAILLLFVGILFPLFTDESTNMSMISIPLIAISILVILGIFGISLWTSITSRAKPLYFALFLAPVTLVLFAYIRAIDLISQNIVTRTLDFIDLGLMIGLGTFLVFMLKGHRRLFSHLMTALICVLLIASLPIALDPERYLGVRNSILDFEVDGIEWISLSEEFPEIQTDRHYSAVARNLFDVQEDSTIIRRLEGSMEFETDTLMIASERWVTVGTNDHPFGWVQIENDALRSLLNESNVLYVAGPTDYEIYIMISAN